jgi:hypothetical protein
MLLRASGEQDGAEYDLNAITSPTGDAGVDHAPLLRELTEAAIENRWDDLEAVRTRAAQAMGEQETVDALTVAAAFNGITRVADATGIPLDEHTAATTIEMRDVTGIDRFDYAAKSARYSATGG